MRELQIINSITSQFICFTSTADSIAFWFCRIFEESLYFQTLVKKNYFAAFAHSQNIQKKIRYRYSLYWKTEGTHWYRGFLNCWIWYYQTKNSQLRDRDIFYFYADSKERIFEYVIFLKRFLSLPIHAISNLSRTWFICLPFQFIYISTIFGCAQNATLVHQLLIQWKINLNISHCDKLGGPIFFVTSNRSSIHTRAHTRSAKPMANGNHSRLPYGNQLTNECVEKAAWGQ